MKSKHVRILCEQYFENMTCTMKNMLQDELLTDVTLCCKEGSVKAHKLILASVSPYLRKIFLNNPGSQISLVLFGVNVNDLRFLMDLVYKGRIDVSREKVSYIYDLAEELEITGLRVEDESLLIPAKMETEFSSEMLFKGRRTVRVELGSSDGPTPSGSERRISSSGRRCSTSSEKSEKEQDKAVTSDISVIVPRINLEGAKPNLWALKERKYKCDDCPACFKRASHLSRHQLVHTGERPYACELCNKAYSRHDKLKHHLRNAHGAPEEVTALNAELPSDSLYTIGHVQILSPDDEEVTDPSAPIRQEDLPPPSQFAHLSAKMPHLEKCQTPPDVPQKRGRGRPRKYPPKLVHIKRPRGRPRLNSLDSLKRLKARQQMNLTDHNGPVKRPRGRPRINPIDPEPSVKRPRGRPRLNPLVPRPTEQRMDEIRSYIKPGSVPECVKGLTGPVGEMENLMATSDECFMMEPLVEIKTEMESNGAAESKHTDGILELSAGNSFLHSVGLYESSRMIGKIGECTIVAE